MLRPGDKGQDVTDLQEALLVLGYALPRWGADGGFGDETLRAASQCLEAHGAPATLRTGLTAREEETILALADDISNVALPANTYDLRAQHAGIHRYGKRSWKNVKGVTLHQTACLLGEKPLRWKDVGCHFGITRGGKIIYLSDPTWLVVHGHGFNHYDIGIEMDGYYEGIEGNPRTLWQPKGETPRKPMIPTLEMIAAVKDVVCFVAELVSRHRGRLQFLHAHRQASKDRQSDPGSAIWQRVAMPLMDELALSDGGRGFKISDGYPIPEAWNPAYKSIAY